MHTNKVVKILSKHYAEIKRNNPLTFKVPHCIGSTNMHTYNHKYISHVGFNHILVSQNLTIDSTSSLKLHFYRLQSLLPGLSKWCGVNRAAIELRWLH